jgi:hypothetical protein
MIDQYLCGIFPFFNHRLTGRFKFRFGALALEDPQHASKNRVFCSRSSSAWVGIENIDNQLHLCPLMFESWESHW